MKQREIRDFFAGKKITVLGLGLLGRGVGDTIFLAKCGAKLTVTDMKTRKELALSLKKLEKFKKIEYVLGKHRLKDFQKKDLIIKAAGIPLDSPYIAEAKINNIPVEMSTSLFVKLLPEGVIVIGITGTRGKSTTTHLIHHILKRNKKQVHLGGNIRGVSTLALLPKVKSGDIVVLELDSWQLQGFGDSKISPHIAVFTNFMPDHMAYYKNSMARYWNDKANIYRYQKTDDYLIVGKEVAEIMCARKAGKPKGKLIIPKQSVLSKGLKMQGKHNRENAARAIAVAEVLGIPESRIKKALKTFGGVPGRLERIRTVDGIEIYNDTTSTTPDAAIAALYAFPKKKNIILIMGGFDKGLDMEKLTKELPARCKEVVLLAGTGTKHVKKDLKNVPWTEHQSLKSAVKRAFECAIKGDIILLSPAFASFGMFKNEFDRGDQFNKIITQLR